MSKGRILVVEDDFDISNMLRIYFTGQGYDVQVAPRGGDALMLTRKQLPQLIVLDIMLPDMNGFDVCRELRTTARTSHIPIIFLTQKDERADKIAGLELGADDYVTKPFDIEELKLRVKNQIERAEREQSVDPNSNLPSSRLIEDKLRHLVTEEKAWTYIDVKIMNSEPFKDVYGFVAWNEVQRFTALLIGEIIDTYGTPDDFPGHPGNDNFILVTFSPAAKELEQALVKKFNEDVQQHYTFIDRERGKIIHNDEPKPLMTMGTGSVSSANQRFSDIREITELAAEVRRRGGAGEVGTVETAW